LSTYSVTAVTRYIKDALETDDLLGDLWVAGEVSDFKTSTAGHVYFTLKDAQAALSCVLWRSQAARLRYLPRDGHAVVLHGRITVYEVRGAYQLQVDQIQPEGEGLLHLEFEALKKRLEEEGLFSAARKRQLPRFPQRIGVATSPTAAVLKDILNVLRRRYPLARVLLAPTAVQGAEAPEQIAAAIATLNALGDIDVIIVARGGGSLEELWAFNDERVARAIAASAAPVVSAVGHETDFTIADFVADVRAPTPSAAAEIVAPDVHDLLAQVTAWRERLDQQGERALVRRREVLYQRVRLLARFAPQQVIDGRRQQTDDLARVATVALTNMLAVRHARLAGVSGRLGILNPLSTLERGYAIVRLAASGEIVRRVTQVSAGDDLSVRVADGQFGATAGGVSKAA
jgi:exodeoxyribonuclease VII large subunit